MKKLTLKDLGFKIIGEEERFDERGNLVYKSYANGFVKIMDYDSNNNLIRYQDSSKQERNMSYNEFNILIEEIMLYNEILSYVKTFNEKGILIYDKELVDDEYIEYWYEHDDNDNVIHYKENNGREYWAIFDANKNEISRKFSDGHGWERKYNSNNNIVYQKDFINNLERHWIYNSDEKLIKYYNSDGQWEINDYNDNGEIIHSNTSYSGEKWYLEEGVLTLVEGEYTLDNDDGILKVEKINTHFDDLISNINVYLAELKNSFNEDLHERIMNLGVIKDLMKQFIDSSFTQSDRNKSSIAIMIYDAIRKAKAEKLNIDHLNVLIQCISIFSKEECTNQDIATVDTILFESNLDWIMGEYSLQKNKERFGLK